MTSAQLIYCEIDFPYASQEGRLSAIFNEPECILIASEIIEVSELLSKVEAYEYAGYWVVGFVAYEAAEGFDKALQISELERRTGREQPTVIT
jgi:hypothetical protein